MIDEIKTISELRDVIEKIIDINEESSESFLREVEEFSSQYYSEATLAEIEVKNNIYVRVIEDKLLLGVGVTMLNVSYDYSHRSHNDYIDVRYSYRDVKQEYTNKVFDIANIFNSFNIESDSELINYTNMFNSIEEKIGNFKKLLKDLGIQNVEINCSNIEPIDINQILALNNLINNESEDRNLNEEELNLIYKIGSINSVEINLNYYTANKSSQESLIKDLFRSFITMEEAEFDNYHKAKLSSADYATKLREIILSSMNIEEKTILSKKKI